MPREFRRRVQALLLAACLVGAAVVARVWLAATGGYHQGALSLALRAASGLALLSGLALAALAVAWPESRRRASGPPPADGPHADPAGGVEHHGTP